MFHTLVENAVTHGARPSAPVQLSLTGARRGAYTRYVFDAPLGDAPQIRRAEGAGTRYIRARLRESFGAQWTFTAGAVEGVWRTEIELPARSP